MDKCYCQSLSYLHLHLSHLAEAFIQKNFQRRCDGCSGCLTGGGTRLEHTGVLGILAAQKFDINGFSSNKLTVN